MMVSMERGDKVEVPNKSIILCVSGNMLGRIGLFPARSSAATGVFALQPIACPIRPDPKGVLCARWYWAMFI